VRGWPARVSPAGSEHLAATGDCTELSGVVVQFGQPEDVFGELNNIDVAMLDGEDGSLLSPGAIAKSESPAVVSSKSSIAVCLLVSTPSARGTRCKSSGVK